MYLRKLLNILLVILLCVAMIPSASAADDSEEPYVIWVDGIKFTSNQEMSEETWSYDPSSHLLELSNYNGAEIVSYGDLTIWASGETTIQGNHYYGIYCSGDLHISCIIGMLTVQGGAARTNMPGYAAVHSQGEFSCDSVSGCIINLIGGSCDQEGYSGGYAVYAPHVLFYAFGYDSGQINVTGGAAYAPATQGGYAIYADTFSCYSDCTLIGGAGATPVSAVRFFTQCIFGHVDASLSASGAGQSAFMSNGNLYIQYADFEHSEDFSEWVITPRDYTLTLDGNGGTIDGERTIVLNSAFQYNIVPANIDLSIYSSTRLGYKQTAWQTAEGASVALDAVYTPPFDAYSSDNTNITLTAVWECVGPEIAVSDGTLSAVVPDDWCAENNVSVVLVALYAESGRMLQCEILTWTEGEDISFEQALTGVGAHSCTLFFLDDNNVPIDKDMVAPLSQ